MFDEWVAYYKIEPFGANLHYYNTGILAALYANTHKAKNKKAYKPSDFIPRYQKPILSQKEAYNKLKAITLMFNGKVE